MTENVNIADVVEWPDPAELLESAVNELSAANKAMLRVNPRLLESLRKAHERVGRELDQLEAQRSSRGSEGETGRGMR